MTADRRGLTRRQMLAGSGVLFAWPFLPKLAFAQGRDPRLLVIVLRGGLDGLSTVAPVGDPEWIGLRGDKALIVEGQTPALPLDYFFALNPAMPNLHRLYHAQQATIIHAAATGYRERSHFDGQDVLESGLPRPGTVDTGWLNRALGLIEPGGRVDRGERGAFAVGPVTPLIVRGPAPVLSWTPQRLLPASDDTRARLFDLYQHTDPKLAQVLDARAQLNATANAGETMEGREAPGGALNPGRVREYFAHAAGTAAAFLARPNGPRIGALALNGWDTHVNEGAVTGRLAILLGALDGAIAAVEKALAAAWSETVVALITEFGRTARINGTDGTDHGTATVALLAGGALKGGRVIADWPGIGISQLYQNRDLAPTTDLRAVLKGILGEHLSVGTAELDATVFPGSRLIRPIDGLVRTA